MSRAPLTTFATLRDTWTHALLRERGLAPLAVFRMGWALAMLMMTADEWSRAALYRQDSFHLALFLGIAPPSLRLLRSLLQLAALGAVSTLVGLLPRLAAALVVAVHAFLFASDLLLFRNHVYLGLLLGVLLVCSPCGAAWSVQALLDGRKKEGAQSARRSIPSVQLIKVQILIVYAWSVVNKLNPTFLQGWTLQRELPYALAGCPLSPWLHDAQGALLPAISRLLNNPATTAGAAWLTLLVELALVFGLPSRRLRPLAVVLGTGLHVAIFCLMSVATFGLLMLSSYVLFWCDPEHERKQASAFSPAR